ncbi:MAG: hypothetical protein U1G07_05825 [Verrucomicrobiota bacterium]
MEKAITLNKRIEIGDLKIIERHYADGEVRFFDFNSRHYDGKARGFGFKTLQNLLNAAQPWETWAERKLPDLEVNNLTSDQKEWVKKLAAGKQQMER